MTIVGRTGHMTPQVLDKDGNVVEEPEYVADTVTARVVEPGGWAVTANDKTEAKARARGHEAIEAAKEQMREQVSQQVALGLLTPDKAARVRKEAKL